MIFTGTVIALVLFIISRDLFLSTNAKKKNKGIIKSKAFVKLKDLGFKEIQFKDFHYLTGNYKGLIFDIFYDKTLNLISKGNGAIVLNTYYSFPASLSKKEEIHLLKKLKERDKVSFWGFRSSDCIWEHYCLIGRIGLNGLKGSVRFSRIIKRIDIMVDAIQKEKLHPVSLVDLKILKQKYPNRMEPYLNWEIWE